MLCYLAIGDNPIGRSGGEALASAALASQSMLKVAGLETVPVQVISRSRMSSALASRRRRMIRGVTLVARPKEVVANPSNPNPTLTPSPIPISTVTPHSHPCTLVLNLGGGQSGIEWAMSLRSPLQH